MQPGVLTLGACSGSGPTNVLHADGGRTGFEPGLADQLAAVLGLSVQWMTLEWADLYGALAGGRIDGILYNQTITAARRELADFTRPYGVFHEAVLTVAGSNIRELDDLAGRRLGAIERTNNHVLAQAIAGDGVVSYPANAEGFDQMLEDLRRGRIDALVDNEIWLGPYTAEGFQIAFTIRTGNVYGIAVVRGSALRTPLDDAISAMERSGVLEALWQQSFPGIPYDRPQAEVEHDLDTLRALLREPAAIRVNH
ncbi:hypothetical protein AWB99_14275 [Mycolicibacterium confluentis]|nr:hypothetical protein AWB99_14275 [Mycolicibacterium confluentis]